MFFEALLKGTKFSMVPLEILLQTPPTDVGVLYSCESIAEATKGQQWIIVGGKDGQWIRITECVRDVLGTKAVLMTIYGYTDNGYEEGAVVSPAEVKTILGIMGIDVLITEHIDTSGLEVVGKEVDLDSVTAETVALLEEAHVINDQAHALLTEALEPKSRETLIRNITTEPVEQAWLELSMSLTHMFGEIYSGMIGVKNNTPEDTYAILVKYGARPA